MRLFVKNKIREKKESHWCVMGDVYPSWSENWLKNKGQCFSTMYDTQFELEAYFFLSTLFHSVVCSSLIRSEQRTTQVRLRKEKKEDYLRFVCFFSSAQTHSRILVRWKEQHPLDKSRTISSICVALENWERSAGKRSTNNVTEVHLLFRIVRGGGDYWVSFTNEAKKQRQYLQEL